MTFFFLGRFLKIFDGLDFLEDELSKGLRLPRMNRFLKYFKTLKNNFMKFQRLYIIELFEIFF